MPSPVSLDNAQRTVPQNLVNPGKFASTEHQYLRASTNAQERASQANASTSSSGASESSSKVGEQLVATTLIKPILKQARESNNAPPPFGPSSAEKQFGSLLDNKIADKLVSSLNLSIAQKLSQSLDERSAALDAVNQSNNQAARLPVNLFG